MKKYIALLLMIIPLMGWTEDYSTTDEYNRLESQYQDQISQGLYDKAIETATDLNNMFPDESELLLQLVAAYVKAGKPLPGWVMGTPWPNATPDDIANRAKAEQLLKH